MGTLRSFPGKATFASIVKKRALPSNNISEINKKKAYVHRRHEILELLWFEHMKTNLTFKILPPK